MKKIIVLLIALLLILASGCSNSGNKNEDKGASTDGHLSSAEKEDKIIQTGVKRITSSQLEIIESGDTYQEIINKIGVGTDFNKYISETIESAQYYYLVDETYVFNLSFKSPNDVSAKSGKDYIESLKPAFLPKEFSEFKKKGYLYGVFIDDCLICIGNNAGSEFYIFRDRDAKFSFSDGTAASYKDLTGLNCLLVKVNRVMETYPPQLIADEVIIIKQ